MKRVSALLMGMVVALNLVLSAGAEQTRSFLHPLIQVDDAIVSLAGLPLGEEAVTVTVNGEPFSNYAVATVQEAELPVTYYCMVDQSSSFSMDQKKQQSRGLLTLSRALRPQDSMILVTMGNTLSMGQPLTDQTARENAMKEACVYQAYTTALFENIVKTVNAAAQAQADGTLSCVVLFTDGLDNTGKQNGLEEAAEAVRASGVSLYTVSVMTYTTDEYVVNNARQVERLAEASLGGTGCTPALDDRESATNIEDAVADIVDQVLSGSVLMLDAAQLPRTGSLEVSAAWNGQTDAVSLDPAILPPLPTEPETTVPETTVPETTEPVYTVPETTAPTQPAPRRTSDTGSRLFWLALLCLAGAAVLIVAALVLLRRRRQAEDEDAELEFMDDDSGFVPQNGPAMDIKLDFSNLKDPVKERPALNLSQPVTVPACRVRLVPEGHPQGAVKLTIQANSSVTLGRNSKAQVILNETDTSLSGLHFELQWDSRALYLRDRNSTNGTALNGVPLRGGQWTRVENRAVIQAGALRYTLVVEK